MACDFLTLAAGKILKKITLPIVEKILIKEPGDNQCLMLTS